MQSREAAERRGRVALVPADGGEVTPMVPAARGTPGAGVSLLQASVPARLAMVAVVAAVLWLAVLWAIG